MKLTETQQKGIDLIKSLVEQGKINFKEAIELIDIIYQLTPEEHPITITSPSTEPTPYTPYTPYTEGPYRTEPWVNPWTPQTIPGTTTPTPLPWWEQNKIWCCPNPSTSTSRSAEDGPITYTYNQNTTR